jgi:hypothetical protein
MQKLESRNMARSAGAAGGSKSGKSQSLRLNKQVIRTLTGEDLKLAGGGVCTCCSCTCHSQQAA